MTQSDFTAEEIAAVFPKLAETMAEALGCDEEEITLTASLIDDLDAESIDFLDIVFRLEKTFKVKIPRGKILEDSRGPLSESEFEQNGVVTSAGLAQLKAYLSEVPAERFKTPLNVADIPRLFTPETFLKLVIKAQREQAGAAQ
ncbi:MAG: acyl carrier protein [Cyanobium sp.]|mgnify:CR=1 FL=1|jgi:acyl carrier protein|uniref:acyl carrier protein n=1 Tax=Synechococcales TaxID=1890424 RepID=UPI0020CBA0F6|nr:MULTISPECIES: acyl carrier protein [Synechococcales]MCP9913507.1 acyl carrier protein [Cyanobium sp. BA20m-14]MCT0227666.1 acyl carrier protein [Synechococcus sp. CS-1331]